MVKGFLTLPVGVLDTTVVP